MNIVHVNSIGWWLIILLNFIGFFILNFGTISNGARKEITKAVGAFITTASFILMLIFFGWINTIILLLILWIIVTPMVMALLKLMEKKLYPEHVSQRKKYAEMLNVSEDEVERVSQMDDKEFQEEMRKKYKWLNHE